MQNYEINSDYADYMDGDQEYNVTSDYKNSDFRTVVDEFVDNFEKSKKKKTKKAETGLELFMGTSI